MGSGVGVGVATGVGVGVAVELTTVALVESPAGVGEGDAGRGGLCANKIELEKIKQTKTKVRRNFGTGKLLKKNLNYL